MKNRKQWKQVRVPKSEQPLYMQCSVVCAANVEKRGREALEQQRKETRPHET